VKTSRSLVWCAFALCVPSLASADESVVDWTKHRVHDGLVQPLKQQEDGRGRFGRGRPPPRERRVRVLAATTTMDARGRAFVAYAVDVRFGSGEWQKDDILGCAYRDTGELFVKSGDDYRPAAFLLGKDVPSVVGACRAAPPPPPQA
jgi:hypothetical protein